MFFSVIRRHVGARKGRAVVRDVQLFFSIRCIYFIMTRLIIDLSEHVIPPFIFIHKVIDEAVQQGKMDIVTAFLTELEQVELKRKNQKDNGTGADTDGRPLHTLKVCLCLCLCMCSKREHLLSEGPIFFFLNINRLI